MGGAGCNCGCSGSHAAGCPQFDDLVGTFIALRAGDACGATDSGNAAVLDIKCTLGLQLQPLLDMTGRLKASLGLQPYRVFLVWEQRVDSEEFTEVRRVELMPVEVRGLNEVRIVLGADGRAPDGQLLLVGISPNQVSQDDLLGRLEGRAWDRDGERFFYEVRLHERCAGRSKPTAWRWTVDGVPELRSPARAPAGWMIRVTDQRAPRGRHGEDQTTAIGVQPEAASRYDVFRR